MDPPPPAVEVAPNCAPAPPPDDLSLCVATRRAPGGPFDWLTSPTASKCICSSECTAARVCRQRGGGVACLACSLAVVAASAEGARKNHLHER